MVTGIAAAALSGLQAAQTRLSVSANNVANQFSVDGDEVYQAQRAEQTPLASGGVQAEVQLKDPATVPLAMDGKPREAPNVNEAEEVVQQQLASYDFKANLKVLKAADEMAEELVNIVA